ncbi:hypothetical protein VTN00DRAFT_10045 [Thermoascus crustaceus]|uniref:uncharacterized protein n=1 Tax=Thermoascus crustaceus TaxID=5088 RepID=UPI00374376E2
MKAFVAALLASAAGVAAFSPAPPASCCSTLAASELASKLTVPGQGRYESSVDSYFSKTAQLRPNCVITPLTPQDVSLAVSTLASQACQFAVRGGGHTAWAGAANIEEGVTIDLSWMNSTTYHPGNSTASIGPGARWGSVYSTLEKYNVTVVGGRASTVGLGLVLGGGNSFLAARYGLACDNIVNCKIVLANGDIVNANHNENPDLFQALKGGSNNFGIVVEFDLQAFHQPAFWGGVVVYPNSTTSRQVTAFVNFSNHIEDDPYASVISIWSYSSTTKRTQIMNIYDYSKPMPKPAAFNEFLSVPGNLSDTTRISNHADLTSELSMAYGLRDNFWTLTFVNDERMLQKAIDIENHLAASLGSASGEWTMNVMFQPIPTIFAQHSAKKGGNVLGLDRATENLVLFQFNAAWEHAEDDALFYNAGDTMINKLTAYAKEIDKYNEFLYLNYASSNQDPLDGYGVENVRKLQAVSKKYDPRGVFQQLVPGGFKLFKKDTENSAKKDKSEL